MSPQLPSVLVRTTLFRAGAKYGGNRPELASIGTHQFAAPLRIDRTRLCHPNDHVESTRRRRCRSRRPKTHNDFLPTWFGFHLLHSRHSRDRWMDRIVAGNDVCLFIGVHSRLRSAEPCGLGSTDGARRGYSQRRRRRRYDLATKPARRPGGCRPAHLSDWYRTNLLFLLLCVAERGLLVGRYPFRASAHRSLLRRPLAAHDGRPELYLEERD